MPRMVPQPSAGHSRESPRAPLLAGWCIRLTRSRIQSISSSTTCAPGRLVVELVPHARIDASRDARRPSSDGARLGRHEPVVAAMDDERRHRQPIERPRRPGAARRTPRGRTGRSTCAGSAGPRCTPRRPPGRATGPPRRGGSTSSRPGATRRRVETEGALPERDVRADRRRGEHEQVGAGAAVEHVAERDQAAHRVAEQDERPAGRDRSDARRAAPRGRRGAATSDRSRPAGRPSRRSRGGRSRARRSRRRRAATPTCS